MSLTRKQQVNKAWREAHREELLLKKRQWYLANRERMLLRAQERYTADPIEARARQRAQYHKHQAKRRAAAKAYNAANRAHVAQQRKAFRLAHAAALRAKRKAYCLTYPDRVRASKRAHWQKYAAPSRDRRRAYRQAHKEKIRARWNRWARANPEKVNAFVAQRKAAKLRATPAWANHDAIAAFYAEAARLTRETGIPHTVDHYYPLLSPVVCGLHVEHNLRVITRSENSRKRNRHPDWSDAYHARHYARQAALAAAADYLERHQDAADQARRARPAA
jgi:hypothetical protein